MQIRRKITIEAHATEYKGIIFRSKLEVRWAFLLDCLSINWQYEPTIYTLHPTNIFPDGCRYVPDFQLDFCTIEVKPNEPTAEEIAKAIGVLSTTRLPFHFLIGLPGTYQAHSFKLNKKGKVLFGIIPNCAALNIDSAIFDLVAERARRVSFIKKEY